MFNMKMCINEFCPLKSSCIRYTGISVLFEYSYGEYKPFLNKKGRVDCLNYVRDKERDPKEIKHYSVV